MCGIVGAFDVPEVSNVVRLALHRLQHRGQEAAGLVVLGNRNQPIIRKGLGLVIEALGVEALDSESGRTAIGHNRYSTSGGSTVENIQPLLIDSKDGWIALAHNGTLTNGDSLRQGLKADGAIFSSSIDSEVIVHLIARAEGASIEERLQNAIIQLQGAFSLVLLIGQTLFAVRDRYGWRPLSLGQLGNGYIVASETCAFDLVEANYRRDIKAGEILKISKGGLNSSIFATAEQRRCVFEHVYFARPDSLIFNGSVNQARRSLGIQLAKEHPTPGADLIFAVPDSANEAAIGYAQESGIRPDNAFNRDHYIGRTFIQPAKSNRQLQSRIKYNVVREVVAGKNVVMVDDSIVRGMTTELLVQAVRDAGAREVHVRISSPPIVGPCHYGIDTPTYAELIAADRSVEQIRQKIGADSLGYLSQNGMLNAVPGGPAGFCFSCFSGKYPVDS